MFRKSGTRITLQGIVFYPGAIIRNLIDCQFRSEAHLAPGPRQDEGHGECLIAAVAAILVLLSHHQVRLLFRVISGKAQYFVGFVGYDFRK